MNNIKAFVSRVAILSLVLTAACGDDNPVSSDPGANVVPKAGSSYTVGRVRLDSNNVKVPGSDTSYSMSVISTGNSYAGKSNLVILRQDSTDIYVSYESNGDYSLIPKTDDPTVAWTTYPAGSKTTFYLPTVDTIIEDPFGGGDLEIASSGSITHAGIESVTVPAGTFQTHRLVQTVTSSLGIGGIKVSTTSTTTLSYAPSIGWVVKAVARHESSNPISSPSGNEEVLTSYSLK